MHSRREVRESTIQFLYCYDLQGGTEATLTSADFWELLLEDDFIKLTKASIKSVLHLSQGRQKRYIKLVEKSSDLQSILTADSEAKKLNIALSSILKSEGTWQSLIDRLQRVFQPELQEITADASDALQEVYLLNNTLIKQRSRWHHELAKLPQYQKATESINASITALSAISTRITMVQDPAQFPNYSDVKHLLNIAKKIALLKEEVNALTELVVNNKQKIDHFIHQVVEHYKPERIAPVDRAILRLGAAEILYKTDIPNPVSINEALEISQLYGSTDSPKFINGILDRIANK